MVVISSRPPCCPYCDGAALVFVVDSPPVGGAASGVEPPVPPGGRMNASRLRFTSRSGLTAEAPAWLAFASCQADRFDGQEPPGPCHHLLDPVHEVTQVEVGAGEDRSSGMIWNSAPSTSLMSPGVTDRKSIPDWSARSWICRAGSAAPPTRGTIFANSRAWPGSPTLGLGGRRLLEFAFATTASALVIDRRLCLGDVAADGVEDEEPHDHRE